MDLSCNLFSRRLLDLKHLNEQPNFGDGAVFAQDEGVALGLTQLMAQLGDNLKIQVRVSAQAVAYPVVPG
jgi:hypothetical protein